MLTPKGIVKKCHWFVNINIELVAVMLSKLTIKAKISMTHFSLFIAFKPNLIF